MSKDIKKRPTLSRFATVSHHNDLQFKLLGWILQHEKTSASNRAGKKMQKLQIEALREKWTFLIVLQTSQSNLFIHNFLDEPQTFFRFCQQRRAFVWGRVCFCLRVQVALFCCRVRVWYKLIRCPECFCSFSDSLSSISVLLRLIQDAQTRTGYSGVTELIRRRNKGNINS